MTFPSGPSVFGAGVAIVVMVLAIPLAAIVGGTLVALVRALRGSRSERDVAEVEEETRLIQDMHEGFLRMEERIEALETILLEKCERSENGGKGGKRETGGARLRAAGPSAECAVDLARRGQAGPNRGDSVERGGGQGG